MNDVNCPKCGAATGTAFLCPNGCDGRITVTEGGDGSATWVEMTLPPRDPNAPVCVPTFQVIPAPALAEGVHLCPRCKGTGVDPDVSLTPNETCRVCKGAQFVRVFATHWEPFPRVAAGESEETR
uniref:Uncharacterized protein n=1 Tax=viral metagenome TaxID=1070528 RepID=A0A6M3LYB9_9ZZZZ